MAETESGATTAGATGQEQAQPGAASTTGERTFTQADVDRVVAERLARAKDGEKAALAKAAERFGVKSLDELEPIVKSHREHEEASKTELDKLRESNAAHEQRATAAEAEAKAAKRDRLFERALRKAGATDDTLDAAFRLTDFPDDLDEKEYETLAAATLTAHPYLAGQVAATIPSTRGASGRGAGGNSSGESDAAQARAQRWGFRTPA